MFSSTGSVTDVSIRFANRPDSTRLPKAFYEICSLSGTLSERQAKLGSHQS